MAGRLRRFGVMTSVWEPLGAIHGQPASHVPTEAFAPLESREHQIGTEGICGLHLPQLLDKAAFFQVSEIVFSGEPELELPFGRSPLEVMFPLGQSAVVRNYRTGWSNRPVRAGEGSSEFPPNVW